MIRKIKQWLRRPPVNTLPSTRDTILPESPISFEGDFDPSQKKSRRKWIFAIAIPIIFQNITQYLQMVIDRAFLGHTNPEYLSAIGNVMTPFSALVLFLTTSSIGLTILVAQNIGAKKLDSARDLSESSFVYSTLFALSLLLVWLFGAQGIFTLLQTGENIKTHAVNYVQIISFSMIFMGMEATAGAILQGVGKTKPILLAGVIKNILNIFLDWVLIFGQLGFPQMGLFGAAVATFVSNSVGSLILIAYVLFTKSLPFRFSFKALIHPKFRLYWKTMALGLPSGFESFLWFFGQLVITRFVNHWDVLSGGGGLSMGIVSLVQGAYLLGLYVYLGYARAATTLVGQLWGAKKYALGKISGYHAQKLGLYVSLFWSVMMFIFPEFLAGIFGDDPRIIEPAIVMIRLSALFVNFQCVNVIMGHAIRGTGDTRWMLYTQIGGTLFVVVTSYYSMFVFGWGLKGLYITLIADEFIRSIINFLKFSLTGHKLTKQELTPQEAPL